MSMYVLKRHIYFQGLEAPKEYIAAQGKFFINIYYTFT